VAHQAAYDDELERVKQLAEERGSSGSNLYYTAPYRVSKRFARALITHTLEGRTSNRKAFRLLGSKKLSTFEELSQRIGVV
jgi:hypothetical protein